MDFNIGHNYTNHYEIMKRLSRIYKTKDFNADDVHDWCAEAEVDLLRDYDYFVKFLKIPLEVHGKNRVNLPCNIDSIIDLYTKDNARIGYNHFGNNISLINDTEEKFLYIDYKGLPINPTTGDVLILRGHEAFCVAVCARNAYYDDYLNAKLDHTRWAVMDEEAERGMNIANTDMRRFDKGSKNQLEQIVGDVLPMIGRTPLYKQGGF